ncbi:MAG: helix-turn-helix domain-containing protein [Candidatus Omnitrophica bacterium]|nr:helix-turn-helix domain-containing protein [Candidatus Omnitrophota bacterium]
MKPPMVSENPKARYGSHGPEEAASAAEKSQPRFEHAGFLSISVPAIQRPEDGHSLGNVIRHFRKQLGLSQQELAGKAGVDRTTIARLECGIMKTISMDKLEGIAAALGMDIKTLLIKAESMGESLSCRSDTTRVEFSLDFPGEGFRIVSHIPKRRDFFFGKIEIEAHKAVATERLPHPEQIYLHALDGKILLNREGKEFLLKAGDCFAFSGRASYELYNPDLMKGCSALFITYPSFLPV